MLFAQQLSQHLDSNDLYGERQSSYRKYHSTVTALVRVTSDILQAIDIHGDVVLILHDLTAAFDVINHELLLYGEALWYHGHCSAMVQILPYW